MGRTNSKLGDKRLEKAYQGLLESMCVRHTVILRQLGTGLAEQTQFWRFINNAGLNPDVLLEHHWSESRLDVEGKQLLVIGDSTRLGYWPQKNREPLGYLGTDTIKEGFDMHPCLMVDAEDEACYGLGSICFYQRPARGDAEQEADRLARRKEVWKLPFEEKESYKWFEGAHKAINNCSGAASYTLMGDRESDIYDLIDYTLRSGWHYLYRSRQDRKLAKGAVPGTLYQLLDQWSPKLTYDLDLPATRKRASRQARLELKFGPACIGQPKNNNKDEQVADQIDLYVVQVAETACSAPPNEPPLHWILLTSHPIHTIEDALKIVNWYRIRWTIEQSFRTLKSQGLNIEGAQLETYHGLKNLATMAIIAAVQIMELLKAREGKTSQKMDQVFFEKEQQCIAALNTKLNGKTEKSKNPHPPDSLAFATWVIARLGGWTGYQKQRPPGPITLVNGLTRFYHILEGYYLIL